MRFRQEARIACSLLMLGMALSTLSSLTGLNLTGRGDVPTTLLVGALVLGMVFATGPVMVGSGPWAPLAAIGVGAAATATGWLLQVHPFLWQYPAAYTVVALAGPALVPRREREGMSPRAASSRESDAP